MSTFRRCFMLRFLFCSLLFSFSAFAVDQPASDDALQQSDEMLQLPEAQPMQPALPAQPNPCAALSAGEQAFAKDFDMMHQQLFCKQFTPEQRQQAMGMAGKRDAQGVVLTPVSSVDLIAKQAGIQVQQMMPGKSCPMGGEKCPMQGCPMK